MVPFIPQAIDAQMLLAYQLVIEPGVDHWSPGGGGGASAGTYVKRNKISFGDSGTGQFSGLPCSTWRIGQQRLHAHLR